MKRMDQQPNRFQIWLYGEKYIRLTNSAKNYIYKTYIPSENSHIRLSRSAASDVKFSISSNVKRPPVSYNEKEAASAVRSVMRGENVTKAASILESTTEVGFVESLLDLIREKQLKDSSVYKAAGIDRRLYSKIVSDASYKPSKDTCIAFALALQLTYDDAADLLSRAGYSLSHSIERDVVMEFFFREGVYTLSEVNEVLYRLNMKMLGR